MSKVIAAEARPNGFWGERAPSLPVRQPAASQPT